MRLRLPRGQRDPRVAAGMPVIQRPPRAVAAAGEQGQPGEPEDDPQPAAAALAASAAPSGWHRTSPAAPRRRAQSIDEHRRGKGWLSRTARRRMLASWFIARTEHRVPSAACQCAIHASSAGNGSGSPVRSIRRSPFSVMASQPSMPGPMTGPRHSRRELPPQPLDRVRPSGRAEGCAAHRSPLTCQAAAYDRQFAAARSASSSRTQP